MTLPSTFDAVIVGAGPAGTAAAIGLARAGRRVAVVEKAAFPRRKVCGEFVSATSVPVLDALGIGSAWRDRAGPEVRRLSLFEGERVVDAPMPGRTGFGRALGRDVLDALLRDEAVQAGATLFQPCRATAHRPSGSAHVLRIKGDGVERELSAPVLIAAHGSWEPGALPTQLPKQPDPKGFLGFKAHFQGGRLPRDTMPVLAFPGGYGGMVWADGGRLSLSCCVRSDVLRGIRRPGESAGAAVQRHLEASCRGVREALDGAWLDGAWLGAGPIRPGVRARYADDAFRVGNVAGEAHPVIAEGISMALQSSWLLVRALDGIDVHDPDARVAAGARYAAAWRRQFGARIRAANAFAQLAMRPETFRAVGRAIELAPGLLTLGARLSGKAKPVPTAG